MLGLSLKNVPCYYDLGFNPCSQPGLEIKAHQDFLEMLKTKTEYVESKAEIIKEEHGFDYSLDLNGNFGFENSFINKGKRNSFVEFFIPIPSLSSITNEKCDRCHGTGMDPNLTEQKCLICRGTGRKIKQDWDNIRKTVLSISLFTEMARFSYNYNSVKSSYRQQLISFAVFVNERYNSVGGDMSPLFCEYLRNRISRKSIINIQSAMNQIDSHIWNRERGNMFQAYVEKNGFLVFNSLNAGLCPINFMDENDGKGVEFSSNDRPSIADVLVLLTGLFVACQQARTEL